MTSEAPVPRQSSARGVALVAGDVTIDWNLARTRRDAGDATAWTSDASTRAYWQPGGAALLGDLVAAVARDLEERGQASWQRQQSCGPIAAVRPDDPAYHHSYAVWSNHAGPTQRPLWRVEEFLGLDPIPSQPAAAEKPRARRRQPTVRTRRRMRTSSCWMTRRWDIDGIVLAGHASSPRQRARGSS